MLQVLNNPPKSNWPELLKRPSINPLELQSIVKTILDRVKKDGDQALFDYTKAFDGADLQTFLVSEYEIAEAVQAVPSELKDAIAKAARNIRVFHEAQAEDSKVVETQPGVKCWRKSVGIEKVGLYIPGGSAPLFSTVLMLGIPASIAGCKEVILCTPPDKAGKINPAILFAADFVGIKKIFKVGGAQAVAAMSYGTETVPACYKIFGPGNQYVTCAKTMISLEGVAIDMPAGPSEVAVICDESSNPAFVAADLLSQAEHGADSQVLLLSTYEPIVAAVQAEIEKQLKELPRQEVASAALKNSKALVFSKLDTLLDAVNFYAPEHLIIATNNANKFVDRIINAGSVFLGPYTPETAGDYASGTNHTLPTSGFAKNYSGVSLDSFVKKITFQEISKEGLKGLQAVLETMAAAEQLDAHKNAVTIRLISK